jgi:hypothetical protein
LEFTQALFRSLQSLAQALLAKEAEVAERVEALASRKAEMAARSIQVSTQDLVML